MKDAKDGIGDSKRDMPPLAVSPVLPAHFEPAVFAKLNFSYTRRRTAYKNDRS
jgi:hypothetical protein